MATHHPFLLEVFRVLGNAPGQIDPGRIQRFGVNGKAGDTAGWSLMFAHGQAGVFGDFRSGATHAWKADAPTSMNAVTRAAWQMQIRQARAKREVLRRDEQAANAAAISALWMATEPVAEGDAVSLYLARRGLRGAVPESLRLHPNLRYWDSATQSDLGHWPAMVAPLMHPDGRMLALHRTYLSADGLKAPVPVVKKLTGAAGPLAGACIPLHEARLGAIGIAEGIETAQAAYLASGIPTVAAYCAGNLASYVWPPDIQRIVIFADADPAGVAAAQALKARAANAGINAVCLTPSTPDTDWADVWANRNLNHTGAAE